MMRRRLFMLMVLSTLASATAAWAAKEAPQANKTQAQARAVRCHGDCMDCDDCCADCDDCCADCDDCCADCDDCCADCAVCCFASANRQTKDEAKAIKQLKAEMQVGANPTLANTSGVGAGSKKAPGCCSTLASGGRCSAGAECCPQPGVRQGARPDRPQPGAGKP
jgi:hypothetical protein